MDPGALLQLDLDSIWCCMFSFKTLEIVVWDDRTNPLDFLLNSFEVILSTMTSMCHSNHPDLMHVARLLGLSCQQ
jgi:hypothetical protein